MAVSVSPEAGAGPPDARREQERTLREEVREEVREELRRVMAVDALPEPGPGKVERVRRASSPSASTSSTGGRWRRGSRR
jgi:hypothetical protein